MDNGVGNVGLYTSLQLNNDGFPVISYYDINNGDLKLAVCNDDVCSNPTIITVDGDDGGNVGLYTSLQLNNDGFPVISYYDVGHGALKLAVCDDSNCANPTRNVVDDGGGNDVGQYTSLQLNDGKPVISYFDATDNVLKLAVCDEVDCSGPIATRVVDDGGGGVNNVGSYTSLQINGNGDPVISYYDSTNDDPKVGRLQRLIVLFIPKTKRHFVCHPLS